MAVKAQERITILDPEVTFSYLLPKGYVYTDDPYYHYVYPKSGGKDQLPRLTFTYFEKSCPNLDDCFDGKLNGELRTEFSDFNILEKNNLILDATPAILATYTFTKEGTKLEGILCSFVKYGNYFVLEAQYPADKEADYTSVFEGIIKSFEISKK